MVDFLIEEKKFGKLLAPDQHAVSSLYLNRMPDRYIDFLNRPGVKGKISFRKRK